MSDVIIHLTTTIISGCIVAIFTHWLRNRNDKKDDK
ncbi:type I toxin-antitoxin system Fst family toxin [Staphylococcus warneri]